MSFRSLSILCIFLTFISCSKPPEEAKPAKKVEPVPAPKAASRTKNIDPESANQLLAAAVDKEDPQEAQTLLQSGADPNSLIDGLTPLIRAVRAGNAEIAKLLVDGGATVTETDAQFPDPITEAIQNQDVDLVKLLLKSGAKTRVERDGMTACMFSVIGGNDEIMRLVFTVGGSCEPVSHTNQVLLEETRKSQRNLRKIQNLLKFGARSEEAVAEAAARNDMEVLKLFVEARANLDQRYGTLDAPIGYAIEQQNLEMLQLLLEGGADPDQRCLQGAPLVTSVKKGNLQMVKILLDSGAHPNDGFYEENPLIVAINQNQMDIARLLVGAGTNLNPDPKKDRQFIPLIYAIEKERTQFAKLFVEAGTDPNTAQNDGTPVLLLAVRWGNTEVVQSLLKAGAFRDAVDREGRNAVQIAMHYGHTDLARLLMKK